MSSREAIRAAFARIMVRVVAVASPFKQVPLFILSRLG